MNDIFSFARGKILLDTEDIYGRVFSEARSKTAEHNIYERSKNYFDGKNEKPQKLTKTNEN